MNADIITSATHPHGTPAGYLDGCRGSHCPSVMSCRDVYRRHSGDFSFRRLFDAGVPVETILEREAAEAREVKLAARRVPPKPKPKPKKRSAANLVQRDRLIEPDVLKALLAEGLTDRQIADRLGLERRQVTGSRRSAGLPANPDPKRTESIDTRLHEVEGLSHVEAGKVLDRSPTYIRRRREIAKKQKRETA